MTLLINLALFFIGFYVLIKGAHILIRGASSIAKIFALSPWFIGVVIVGIGTSIPEFSINVASVFEGNNVGLATLIGSSTFNILFVLGLTALFSPLVFEREWVVRDLPISLGVVLLTAGLILFPVLGDSTFHGLTRAEGLVLVVLLVVWLYRILRRPSSGSGSADVEAFSWFASFIFIVVGFAGVFFGGAWVVDGAAAIASFMGVSPALIGFTVVAIGTSLPELAVSMVAALKGQNSIAIGNIIGSNIFNFLGIMGMTSLLQPTLVISHLQFDIFAVFLSTLALFAVVVLIGRRFTVSRREGAILLACYVIYFIFLVVRG